MPTVLSAIYHQSKKSKLNVAQQVKLFQNTLLGLIDDVPELKGKVRILSIPQVETSLVNIEDIMQKIVKEDTCSLNC